MLYVKKWFELNKEEYEVWFISKDKDFNGIAKDELEIEFVTNLAGFEAIHQKIQAHFRKNNPLDFALLDKLLDSSEEIFELVKIEVERKYSFVKNMDGFIHSSDSMKIKKEEYKDKIVGKVKVDIFWEIDYDVIADFHIVEKSWLMQSSISCSFIANANNYDEVEVDNLVILHCNLCELMLLED